MSHKCYVNLKLGIGDKDSITKEELNVAISNLDTLLGLSATDERTLDGPSPSM